MTHQNPDEATVEKLLRSARRIAIVGLSPKPDRDSNRIARYLMDHGYEVVPVYPREDVILGQKVYQRVQDIPGQLDLVDVFRRGETLPEVVDDVLAARVPAVWFQYGCVHEEAARKAQEAGLTVVMDRCIMVDHRACLERD